MSDIRVSLKWYPNGTAALTGSNGGHKKVSTYPVTYILHVFEVRSLGSVKIQSLAVDPEKTGLSFSDVCADVGEKRILWSVGGNAKPGKILALMGPSGKRLDQICIRGWRFCVHIISCTTFSGSGKTTLLNCLAGYTQLSSGSITLHGHRMNKRVRRQVSYVLQADIFFPNLTLRETFQVSC